MQTAGPAAGPYDRAPMSRTALARVALAASLILPGLAGCAAAGDPVGCAGGGAAAWNRLRGPSGTGAAADDGRVACPAAIGPDAGAVRARPFPQGFSSPVPGGDRVFLTGLEGGRIWLRTEGQLWRFGPEEERAGAQGRAGD